MFDKVRHKDPNITRDDAEMKKFDKLARSRTLPGDCIVYKVYTGTAPDTGVLTELDVGEELRQKMEAVLGLCTPRVPGVSGVIIWSGAKKIKLIFNLLTNDHLVLDSDIVGRSYSLAIGDLEMDKIWIGVGDTYEGMEVDWTLFITA